MRSLFLGLFLAWTAQSQTGYKIEPFAGTDFSGDGKAAIQAPLLQPQGLAADRDGSVLVADATDNRVRRITADGLIHTVAKDLQSPYGVAVGPNREVYIADLGNRRVRVVSTDGAERTFVSGDLVQPRNVAVDANGAVYISDFGANKVYRATPDGVMRVLLGNDELKGPAGLAIDATGALYIADSGNRRVAKFADGQLKTVLTEFGTVTSIALDRTGRLYVAGGDRIAVVSPVGEVSTIHVAADEVGIDSSGRILTIAYKQIRSVFAGVTTILAGSRQGAVAGDGGPPEEWRFHRPAGLTRDETGGLLIADKGNGRIRRISPEGELSTLGTFDQPAYFAKDFSNFLYVSDFKSGIVYKTDLLGQFKPFSKGSGAKPFQSPSGLCFDIRGDLFVADSGNNLIRKVTPDGIVSTVAGGGLAEGDGFGLGLALRAPVGLAMAADGSIFFTETGRLRKLGRDGKITTILEAPLVDPRGLRIESDGSILVADAGSHSILRIEPNGGRFKVIAGTGEPGFTDKLLNGVSDILPDRDGSILVADALNARVRRLVPFTQDEAAGPITNAPPLRVLHAGTGRPDPIAPGQLVNLEADQPFPTKELQVLFGAQKAEILTSDINRLSVIAPSSVGIGLTQVVVTNSAGPWAAIRTELATASPAVMGAVLNDDGTENSVATPANRMSTITFAVTGEGASATPAIVVTIGGLDAEVISAERKSGLMRIKARVPGGFLPSGVLPLDVQIDGAKLLQEKTVVCR